MRLQKSLFAQGSVGRRLIALFVLCAVVPLTLLAAYALSRVSSELISKRQGELVQMSKNYGMAIIGRTQQLEELLQAAAEAGSPAHALSSLEGRIGREFSGAAIVEKARVQQGIGDFGILRASGALRDEPHFIVSSAGEAVSVRLIVPIRLAGDVSLVAVIRNEFLWAPGDELPASTDVLVVNSQHGAMYPLRTPAATTGWLMEQLRLGAHSGATELSGAGEEAYIGYWTFSLPQLGEHRYAVAASQPAAYVDAPIAAFSRAFIPIALFSALAAALLAMMQIRRMLDPLEKLKSAAARVADNDFSEPVTLRGKDEFAALGSAFNSMSEQIGRQLRTLNRYAEIDRIVLTTLDIETVLKKALREILRVTDAASAAIYLEDAKGGTRRYAISPDEPLLQQDKYSTRLEDIAATMQWVERAQPSEREKYRYGQAIEYRNQRLGVLVLTDNQARRFDENTRKNTAGYLDRIAIALAAAGRERLLIEQARSDSLTALPNRLYFLERLELAVAQALREGGGGVLLFLDLDHFKRANDALGHVAGDTLLRRVADRLKAVVRPGDLLARLGGDEFTLLCGTHESDENIETLSATLVKSLEAAFDIEGHAVFVGLSIGSVRFPRDGSNALDLLRRADTAMYYAKKAGGLRHAAFNLEMEEAVQKSLLLDQALRDGLTHKQFQLYYQAQFDTADNKILGAEALIRWILPDGSVRSPQEWISHAEQTPLIYDIGGWVLNTACRQIRAWDDAGFYIERIAVNIAARQLEDEAFYDRVIGALREAGVAPFRLELEITESQLMASPETGIAILHRLAGLGIAIAVDDFGTGYSSFAQLRQLPLSILKIDRSLVSDVEAGQESGAIVLAIIQMAHALRFMVIAEGVETEAERAALQQFGCNGVQGYLMGLPIPAELFAKLHGHNLAPRDPGGTRLQLVRSKP